VPFDSCEAGSRYVHNKIITYQFFYINNTWPYAYKIAVCIGSWTVSQAKNNKNDILVLKGKTKECEDWSTYKWQFREIYYFRTVLYSLVFFMCMASFFENHTFVDSFTFIFFCKTTLLWFSFTLFLWFSFAVIVLFCVNLFVSRLVSSVN
jgi:hypothetical protein